SGQAEDSRDAAEFPGVLPPVRTPNSWPARPDRVGGEAQPRSGLLQILRPDRHPRRDRAKFKNADQRFEGVATRCNGGNGRGVFAGIAFSIPTGAKIKLQSR